MDYVILWPAFIDSRRSRSEGRKLPRRFCVKSPEIGEIMDAAKRLNLSPKVEKKAYPRRWNSEKEAIMLQKKISRVEAMKKIAKEIRSKRSE